MNLDAIGKIAERKIQEAIEEGQFDNLPGKGQPLNLDEDSDVPLSARLANKVLKNAGVLPEWVQVQKEIEQERQEVAELRARLIRQNGTNHERIAGLPNDHAAVQQYAEWHARWRTKYLRKLKGVNTAILKLSLVGPATLQPPIPYRIEAETRSLDAEFPLLTSAVSVSVEEEAEPGALRKLAQARYHAVSGTLAGWRRTARQGAGTAALPSGDVSEDIQRSGSHGDSPRS